MLRSVVIAVTIGASVAVTAPAAYAQSPKVELSGFASWIFADGVTSEGEVLGLDGNLYSKADPKDSASFGLSGAYLFNDNAEAGFIYSYAPTTLLFGGDNVEREAGDLNVSTYHGYYGYTFGASGTQLRPYLLVGFGATQFGSVDAVVAGVNTTLPSKTKYSPTIGGGVKLFPSPRLGIRAGLRWTPARIIANSAGWWCDNNIGCFVVGGVKYATQVELSGGVLVRF